MKKLCEGCGESVDTLTEVGAFKLCEKCENSYRQVMDDLADMQAKEIYDSQSD
jgi:hypothetical protein